MIHTDLPILNFSFTRKLIHVPNILFLLPFKSPKPYLHSSHTDLLGSTNRPTAQGPTWPSTRLVSHQGSAPYIAIGLENSTANLLQPHFNNTKRYFKLNLEKKPQSQTNSIINGNLFYFLFVTTYWH